MIGFHRFMRQQQQKLRGGRGPAPESNPTKAPTAGRKRRFSEKLAKKREEYRARYLAMLNSMMQNQFAKRS